MHRQETGATMTYQITPKPMPINRFKHCYMVAKVMEYIAKKYYNYNDNQAFEMFMLGYLHDSMYDYETPEKLHHDIIADLVEPQYKAPLKHHSKLQFEHKSDPLDMIYFAKRFC